MKNQQGMLLVNETLKIVLSVIAIGFLVFFLTSLYMAKVHDNELGFAKETISRIKLVLDSGGGNVSALTPKDWYVFGFTEGDKPNSCAGKNCLCICEDLTITSIWKDQSEECSDEGTCLIIEKLTKFNSFEIKEKLTNMEIKKENDWVFISKK